jgi:hypothetical protein
MANLIKLAILLVVATGLAKSDSNLMPPQAKPAVESGPRSKIYIEKPVLLEVNHDTQLKNGQNPDLQIAHLVDPMPNTDLSKVPMPKSETNDEQVKLPSVQLDPIPLMMMPQLPFGMPQFMQQILDSLKSAGSDMPSSGSESNSQSSEESGINGGQRHGSLTILLMKSLPKPGEEDKSANSGADNTDGIKTRKIFMYKFMPRYRLGGKGDPDSDPNFMNNIGNGDKKSVHLLGGDHDLKRFDFIKDQNHLLGEDDFDIDRIREQMPLIGSEDSKIESFFPMTKIDEANQDDSIFAKIKNFFSNIRFGSSSEENIDSEFSRHREEHDEGHKPGKNCMMMKFMRFKSSLYFRTVLHLLFFTGLLMILLCLTMLTIRNIKRRRALRYYNKNLNIATIEGAQTEDEDQDKSGLGSRLFRFRSSGVKTPLVGSFLVQAPPAYDQITIGGGDEKSEAAAYKTKFSKLTNEDDDSTETKSLSSLPGYEQSMTQKEDQK